MHGRALGIEKTVQFIDTANALEQLLHRLNGVERIALDIEGNGMFAYRPRICTVQLAWHEHKDVEVAVVDTIACPVVGLSTILGNSEVLKVIHDLAFDARSLHWEQVDLRAVRDTSVAVNYLGKPGTGLASLLENEFGIRVSKEMQNSDWARRPLSPESMNYLAGDVRHLLALDDRLHGEVVALGIDDEVATETAYRLIDALQTQPESRLPHERIRGTEKLPGVGLHVLEASAGLRERWAEQMDLPPQRILGDKLLVAMALRPPRTLRELLKFGQTKRLQKE